MNDLRDIIAKNISALRLGKGLTQGKLAEILNYSDKAVSKWERGESVPDIAVLKQIADIFGVSVDYLLEEEHERSCEKADEDISSAKDKRHIIIATLSVLLVWLLSSIAFVVMILSGEGLAIPPYFVYLYSLPVSGIVALVFSSLWGRGKMNFYIISYLLWTALLSAYLTLLHFGLNYWLIFLVGIPAQLIVIFWSGLPIAKR